MLLALVWTSMACATSVFAQPSSSEDGLATLLLALGPRVGSSHRPGKLLQSVGNPLAGRQSLSRRVSDPQAIFDKIKEAADEVASSLETAAQAAKSSLESAAQAAKSGSVASGASGGKKKVLVVGVCTKTGDFIARQLSKSFSVTAFCVDSMGELILDDDGPLTSAPVRFIADVPVDAEAVVLAFDDTPPAESVRNLLKSCKDAGAGHIVLLSRLGVSKGIFPSKWKSVEEAAIQGFGEEGLSILRVGNPIEGGPYYKREVDSIKWSSAQAIDGYKSYEVQTGDELSQGGIGSPRAGAAAGIAALLRRGPEEQLATYSMTAETVGGEVQATTAAELDALFEAAGGEVVASAGGSTSLNLDLEDASIQKLTVPEAAAPPNVLDVLFNSPPSVSGGYWGTILIFVYGTYITTTPEYIAKTGIDLWR